MYESKRHQPINTRAFASRLVIHVAVAHLLLLASLIVGMAGYMSLENLSSMDAFLNSAMLLGGMGPVNPPVTAGGKFFAGCYALYAGLVFIVTAALIVVPIAHRVIHRFHWDENL